ncbi:hypothetical protein JCGZ_23067 [Jatropha curcas]|uniref:DYW domain-containing protein n=1 Tax=Jatropha curcas TaxID=180498 RepID=A0A067JUQ1_JATCU|nr:pentatricopeptide repeat-containing protein At3g12770 [Jatropha curcas]KDP23234.1 hypothetical protein JCGZ_23067 [Jatropha curcas]
MGVNVISSARIHTFFFNSDTAPIHISQSKHLRTLRAPFRVKSGALSFAHQVLDEIPLSDTFAWNNLIHTHLTNRDPAGALSIYLCMLLRGARLDRRTFPRVLTASRLCSNLCLGKQLHGQVLKLGFSSDHYVTTALMEMYGRLDGTHAAKWLFDKSPAKNSISWTMLAKLYLTHNQPDLALHVFYQMMDSNIQIDPVALMTAICACGMLKSLQQGGNVHEIARKCGLEFDILVANSLLKMYIDCDSVEDARATFDRMPNKDIISWTELINVYVKKGEFNEALKLFRQMISVGIKPDALSICSILPACARPAAHKLGKQVHAYLLRNGIERDIRIQNAVMDMYIKSGFLQSASLVFARMQERDVISWTVMILGFSVHGQGELGVELFRRLEKDPSIEIDQFTYEAVLRCCAASCMVEDGKFYFNCIEEPNTTHYCLMVTLLSRAALFEEARAFIEKHQIGRNGKVMRALLDGCQVHQQAKIGEQVIEQLFELEPVSLENYVSESNWYAANAKWEMVGKLEEKIKELSLKPKKAYSWIEFHNKIHTFGTGDASHPRSERIYGELQCLMEKMETSAFNLRDARKRECIEIGHSEMLALSFGLISTRAGVTIRIAKNQSVCRCCHDFAKRISKIVEREIIIKDLNCFHHFKDGICSCRDLL